MKLCKHFQPRILMLYTHAPHKCRFGVRQKETVMELCKHFQPHILSMSATPIPRTMALVK